MYKMFCDICGKEIAPLSGWSKYKLKKEVRSFTETFWETLHVHDTCYREMCQYIRDKKENEKE